ncbi:hypothetical protein EV586_108108 [Tumebacillus sp. BK434]|nr:hypothetical protein EV586_108108 [Tumebacillus sp. BK434]
MLQQHVSRCRHRGLLCRRAALFRLRDGNLFRDRTAVAIASAVVVMRLAVSISVPGRVRLVLVAVAVPLFRAKIGSSADGRSVGDFCGEQRMGHPRIFMPDEDRRRKCGQRGNGEEPPLLAPLFALTPAAFQTRFFSRHRLDDVHPPSSLSLAVVLHDYLMTYITNKDLYIDAILAIMRSSKRYIEQTTPDS